MTFELNKEGPGINRKRVLRRDNQDENRATIRMRMRRRGDYEGRAQPDRRNPRGGGERPSGLVWR
jgi:hypothetical protein